MGLMEEALKETAGGGQWAKFENVGDYVQGEIVTMAVRQASDFTTKLPAVSSSGKPKMQLVIGLRVHPATPEDDGVRNVDVNLWGIQREALDEAVQRFGRAGEVGDMMRVEYLGKQKPTYTTSLAHAYRYAIKAGTSPMPATPEPPASPEPPAWASKPAYGDDLPF